MVRDLVDVDGAKQMQGTGELALEVSNSPASPAASPDRGRSLACDALNADAVIPARYSASFLPISTTRALDERSTP